MMKRKSVIAIIFLCTAVLALTSCQRQSAVEDFAKRLSEADSYRISVSVSPDSGGTYHFTYDVDGEVVYSKASVLSPELYITNGSDVYENVDGRYVHTKKSNAAPLPPTQIIEAFFKNADCYEKIEELENTYILKPDFAPENASDVTLRVLENSCVIELTTEYNGMPCICEIVVGKLNEITILLPEFE